MKDATQTHTDLSPYAAAWTLDPAITMLNHGSFGACPRIVLEAQRLLRAAMERNPIGFFMRQMEPLVDASRLALAGLLGADASDLVFVSNVTEGVNSVMRSLSLEAGDEVLVTDHAYNACRNVVDFVTRRAGAKVVVASVPLPITTREEVVQRITDRVTDRTRLALLDHMASPTAVIFPIEELVRRLDQRGVDTLVDGAHTPGMLPVALGRLGAAYYTGNCHKWLCAPKGAGFLHVRADRQEGLYPAVISHGYNHRRPERPPLHEAFDWTGTDDPTPWLCVAEAIRFCDSLIEGGLEALARRNHQLVLTGQRILCEQLGLAPSCPDEMLGSMAALRLPGATASSCDRIHPLRTHPLQKSLQEQFGIEVPVFHWPAPPHTLVRISAHAYNSPSQYRQLADAIAALR